MQTCRPDDFACLLPLGLIVLACLLPLALSILALWRLTVFIQSYYREIGAALRRHWHAIAIVSAVLILVTFDLPLLLNKVTDTTDPYWKFWLQTTTGNWSPEGFPPFTAKPVESAKDPPSLGPRLSSWDRYEFSLSAAVAFWLNNAMIIVLIGLVWRFTHERIIIMKLRTVFAQRDIIIGSTIVEEVAKLLPNTPRAQITEVVKNSISIGRKEWETDTLNDTYGPELAEKLRARMREFNIIP